MSEFLRLFIASPMTGQAREALDHVYNQRQNLAGHLPEHTKWIAPDQWHLTWLFLGNVEASRVNTLRLALRQALVKIESIPLQLEKLVLWPSARKARVLVCQLKPNEYLLQTSTLIREAFTAYPADKPFTPHITLARLKAKPPNPSVIPLDFLMTPVISQLDQVVLYRSHLQASGPVYEPLETVSLHE